MSGHSKWSTIKRKKGAADAKRGQMFTKLANNIALAARDGADPEMNFRLRLAIDKAREANMPNANIEKSIKRGSGQLGGGQIEEIVYEGYGPGGVAVIVECATDNRNRTSSDVRTAFSKSGGSMGESGSVAYQFNRKGVIEFESSDPDSDALEAIEAGADDVETDENVVTVYTAANQLAAVRDTLQQAGKQLKAAELAYVPSNTVPVSDAETARKVLNLMEVLDELDDVSNTFSNFDIDPEIIEQVA